MKECRFYKQKGSIAMFLIIVILIFSPSETACAQDDLADEILSSSELYGVTLNRYHRDQNGYCFLWNDIVLIESELEALMNLSPADQQKRILKRMNFIIRQVSTGRMMDVSQVTVNILQLSRGYSSVGSYTLSMVYVKDSQTMKMTSKMQVVEVTAADIPPVTPIEPVKPPYQPQYPQPDAEEEPPIVYEYEEEPESSENAESAQPSDESLLAEPEAEEEVLDESESIHMEEEVDQEEKNSADKRKDPEQKRKKTVLDYAYVATFGSGGILALIFGIGIFWDFSVILWNKRKRKERRAMRKCQR